MNCPTPKYVKISLIKFGVLLKRRYEHRKRKYEAGILEEEGDWAWIRWRQFIYKHEAVKENALSIL